MASTRRVAGRVLLAGLALLLAGAPAVAEQRPQLSIENLWTLRSLSQPRWAPDGSRLALVVNEPETLSSTIVVVSLDGRQVRLTQPGERQSASLIAQPWTPDGSQLIYTSAGTIRSVDVATNTHRTLVDIRGTSRGYVPQVYFNGPDPVLSPDGRRLAWVQESEIWTLDIQQGGVTKLTQAHGDGWHQMQPVWSPDSTRILFTAQAIDEQRPFPFYDYSGMVIEVSHGLIGYGHVRLGIVGVDGGPVTWLGPEKGERYSLRGGSRVEWSPDGTQVLINRISLDHTEREVLIAPATGGAPRRVWHEKVEHWVSPLAIWARWAPDGRQILLTSERSGWNHVYVVDTVTGADRQVTRGEFTVTSNQVYDPSENTPDWSQDGRTIYFPSNEAGTPERHFYAIDAAGGAARRITPKKGLHVSNTISPDGQQLAYLWSDMVSPPELYVQSLAGGEPRRLTELAMPESLRGHQFLRPEVVQFPSRADGKAVTARRFLPRSFDAKRKYPAVVFVHGGGYVQSVLDGWGSSLDRQAFNQYLAEQGYVVLDVDYRGSAGYGAEFRLDVFDRLGDYDVADVLGGVDYLRTLGYVDMNRLGIWGHSYGGFMTAISMLRAPEVFQAGVSGAPVTDWERFFYLAPGYNEEHFGFPWDNPEGTRRASPLTYADKLAKPMLILSGVQDTMHLDSAVLVNAMVDAKVPVEWRFYPNEAHGFRIPTSREDYFRRAFEFFDRYLRASTAPAASGRK